jgi:hypothetical protein
MSIILIAVAATIGERLPGEGEPLGVPDPPFLALLGVIIYGIMANICFTGGWIAETIVVKVWEDGSRDFGPISFMLGTIFSIALTLLPGIFLGAVLVVSFLIHYISAS